MILHSDRPLPDESPMWCNEGVGVMLDPAMTNKTKKSGLEQARPCISCEGTAHRPYINCMLHMAGHMHALHVV